MKNHEDNMEGAIWISGFLKSSGLGGNCIKKLLQHFGSIQEIYKANTKEMLEVIGGPPDKISRANVYLKNSLNRRTAQDSEKRYQRLHNEIHIKAVAINDSSYPNKLKEITSAPAILYYASSKGIDRLNDGYSVAVIGTRTPSPYGISVTKQILKGFRHTSINIISGMARGIDSLAHLGALDNKLFTAAIIGCGLDIVYPPENYELMVRLMEEGVVISECPPGTMPARSYFPARNRIISGMSDCVVVAEASAKSGTMITAGFAADQGRDVYAIPGSIFSPQSTGTNKLIQDGAGLLTCSEDLLQQIAGFKYQYLNTLIIQNNSEKRQEEDSQHNSTQEMNQQNNNQQENNQQNNNQQDNNQQKMNQHENNPPSAERCIDRIEAIDPLPAYYKQLHKMLKNMELRIDEISLGLNLSIAKTSEILSMAEMNGQVISVNGRFILTDSIKSSIK